MRATMPGPGRAFLAALTCLLHLSVAAPARALVTDFTIDHYPVVQGETSTFVVVDDGNHSIGSYKWEWRCVAPGCSGTWGLANSTTYNMWINHPRVGRKEIRLTVSYGPDDCGITPADSVIIHHVDVSGPDRCEPVGAMDTWVHWSEPVELRFRMYSGDRALGSEISGFIQEYIILKNGQHLDWYPESGPSLRMYVDGNEAVDIQGYGNMTQENWNTFQDGEVDRIKIRYRLNTSNCCGQQRIFHLTTFELIRTKQGNNWKITEVTPRPDPIP